MTSVSKIFAIIGLVGSVIAVVSGIALVIVKAWIHARIEAGYIISILFFSILALFYFLIIRIYRKSERSDLSETRTKSNKVAKKTYQQMAP